MLIKKDQKEKGITIIETLFYATILVLVIGVISQSFISLVRLHRETLANKLIETASLSAMETISREIRRATSVNTSLSSFGVNPGILVLEGKDENENSYSLTFEKNEEDMLQMTKNPGEIVSQITPSSVSVSGLIFDNVQNDNSKGIRIFLQIEKEGEETKIISLRSFNILRGSY